MNSSIRAGWLLAVLLCAGGAVAQEAAGTRELVGRMGRSTAILSLTSSPRADGDWRVTGEYLLVPSLVQRYLEGERSPQLGVTTLREGTSPLFFGRPLTGTLQGTWRDGKLTGVRLAPGGQERERFEFSEEFAAMDAYTGAVHCETSDSRYASKLAFAIDAGRLRAGSFEWRSRIQPSGHTCSLGARDKLAQTTLAGGLRFAAGRCAVTVRDLGDYLRVSAEDCAAVCGSQAYFEPVLVDKRGGCSLTHAQQR
jgi:hypothetical protein